MTVRELRPSSPRAPRACQAHALTSCPQCGRAGAEVLRIAGCRCCLIFCAHGTPAREVLLWPDLHCNGCVILRLGLLLGRAPVRVLRGRAP